MMTSNESTDLNLFFNISKDLFCIAGFDGYFKKINPAVVETLGYTMTELLCQPISTFIHPDDRTLTADRREKLLEGRTLTNFENRYITKSGEVIWLAWTSVADLDQQVVFAVAKNVTARKLEESERPDFRELLYTALHDLRSPVANITSIFNVFEELNAPDGQYKESLALLKTSAEDLRSKLEQFLDRVVSIEAMPSVARRVKLQDALNRVLTVLSASIATSGAQFLSDFSEAPDLYFDEPYLDSILLNLISNSIKYARTGVAPVIRITSELKDDKVILTITDNGTGFDQDAVGTKLFELQTRFHPGTEGRGIGLHLVKTHLENAGGSIEVYSKPGKGTTFTLYFKRSHPD